MRLAKILSAAALLCCLSSVGHAAGAYPSGDPLPPGYLSVSGNQIVGYGQNVRLACVGYGQTFRSHEQDLGLARRAGFNCLRIDYYDVSLSLTMLDRMVAAAAKHDMRVIFDHHGNEQDDKCLGQQLNGLPYDKNAGVYSATDGTDGCGAVGTVTEAAWKDNLVTIARHFAGQPTVIGLDLHNEPLTYGNGQHPHLSWGGGGGADLLAMYQDAGSAINAANPGLLIICEGPGNNNHTLFNGAANLTGNVMDMTLAAQHPVNVPGRVVYSIHDYPAYITGQSLDSGPRKIASMNEAWGFLMTRKIAPVWVGELGANLDNEKGDLARQQAWAATVRRYLNGQAGDAGGPTFSGDEQPIGTDWFAFGYFPNYQLNGVLKADGSLKERQKSVWATFLYHAGGPGHQARMGRPAGGP